MSDFSTSATRTEFSGFGGTPLAGLNTATVPEAMEDAGDGGNILNSLAGLGITDAEQLVAIAAIPDTITYLVQALGVEKTTVESLVAQASGTLAPARRALVNVAAPRDLMMGALLPSEAELNALDAPLDANVILAADAPLALPASVNLIPFMNPVRNQAARGTCVSFALTALNEYVQRRRGQVVDLSEQFLYFKTKQIDGIPNACGTFQSKAIIALAQFGECPESVFPYNPNGPCNDATALPANAVAAAASFRLQAAAVPTRNVAAYKATFALQQVVTLSIPVYNTWYTSQEVRRSGRITMRVGNEAAIGGHAVCLVGYQDNIDSPGGGYFIVRNSWNGLWAMQSPYGVGYGTIPYQYITDAATEAFTAAIPAQPFGEDIFNTTHVAENKTVVIEVGNVRITIS